MITQLRDRLCYVQRAVFFSKKKYKKSSTFLPVTRLTCAHEHNTIERFERTRCLLSFVCRFLDWIFKQRNGTFSVLVQIGRQKSKQRIDLEALKIIVNLP